MAHGHMATAHGSTFSPDLRLPLCGGQLLLAGPPPPAVLGCQNVNPGTLTVRMTITGTTTATGPRSRRERCTTSAPGLPPAHWTSTPVTSAKRSIRACKEGSDAVTNRRASAYAPFGHRRASPFRPAGPGVGSDGPLRLRLRGPRPARGFRSGRMSRESSLRASW